MSRGDRGVQKLNTGGHTPSALSRSFCVFCLSCRRLNFFGFILDFSCLHFSNVFTCRFFRGRGEVSRRGRGLGLGGRLGDLAVGSFALHRVRIVNTNDDMATMKNVDAMKLRRSHVNIAGTKEILNKNLSFKPFLSIVMSILVKMPDVMQFHTRVNPSWKLNGRDVGRIENVLTQISPQHWRTKCAQVCIIVKMPKYKKITIYSDHMFIPKIHANLV